LVIHNAAFDIGFMDYEFSLLKRDIPKTNTFCKVTDSLAVARKMFPGKRMPDEHGNFFQAKMQRFDEENRHPEVNGSP
ncbi:exonuclease domain-containing protein, partial [Escherichia coli]|uniref:exonuclease domain-containing protein n=1 Tax=Escherichia coli TaxID=562 RepID=UPI002813C2EC